MREGGGGGTFAWTMHYHTGIGVLVDDIRKPVAKPVKSGYPLKEGLLMLRVQFSVAFELSRGPSPGGSVLCPRISGGTWFPIPVEGQFPRIS
jgi:hypothetical protein